MLVTFVSARAIIVHSYMYEVRQYIRTMYTQLKFII